MSSLSTAALALTSKVFSDPDGDTKTKAGYEVIISDKRDPENLVTLRFVAKTSLTPEEIEANITKTFTKVQDSLMAAASVATADSMLEKYGFNKGNAPKLGAKRASGSVSISYDKSGDGEDEPDVSAGIQLTTGRYASKSDLRFMLTNLMQEYMLQEMTSPSAGSGRNTPLRNRTGRFVSSANVSKVRLENIPSRRTKKQKLSLYFNYMIAPYSVFDPTVSSYNNLSSAARNPRRILGEALAKAARDLIRQKAYNIEVRQV